MLKKLLHWENVLNEQFAEIDDMQSESAIGQYSGSEWIARLWSEVYVTTVDWKAIAEDLHRIGAEDSAGLTENLLIQALNGNKHLDWNLITFSADEILAHITINYIPNPEKSNKGLFYGAVCIVILAQASRVHGVETNLFFKKFMHWNFYAIPLIDIDRLIDLCEFVFAHTNRL